jgi:hypothetical protein
MSLAVVLKAAPVYIETFHVGDVVHSPKREADVPSKSREEIYTMIKKRLDVNAIPIEQSQVFSRSL